MKSREIPIIPREGGIKAIPVVPMLIASKVKYRDVFLPSLSPKTPYIIPPKGLVINPVENAKKE